MEQEKKSPIKKIVTSLIIFYIAIAVAYDWNENPSRYEYLVEPYKNLFKGKPATTKSSGSSDTSSKEYNCDWPSELLSKGKAYRCANISGCPYGCYRGKWLKYGYSSPKECAKAAMACLNKRCGHLCK
jgi:hypothetical protein